MEQGFVSTIKRKAGGPTVDPEALNPGALNRVDRDTVAIAIPWWLLGVLVIGGAVWLFVVLRRRSDEKRAAAWMAFTEQQARELAAAETTR